LTLSAAAPSSPWCANAAAPPELGMYCKPPDTACVDAPLIGITLPE